MKKWSYYYFKKMSTNKETFSPNEITNIAEQDLHSALFRFTKVIPVFAYKSSSELESLGHKKSQTCLLLVGKYVNGEILYYNDPRITNYKGIPGDIFLEVTKIGDQSKFKLIRIENSATIRKITNYHSLIDVLDLKISDADLSSRLFGGLVKEKHSLINSVFKPGQYEVKEGRSKLLDDRVITYLNIPLLQGEEVKMVKFVPCEVDFTLPNLKGYSLCKDKTIKVHDTVILKRDRCRIPYTVIDIKPNLTSKKMSRSSNTRYKDVISIINGDLVKQVYAKYLKKIC